MRKARREGRRATSDGKRREKRNETHSHPVHRIRPVLHRILLRLLQNEEKTSIRVSQSFSVESSSNERNPSRRKKPYGTRRRKGVTHILHRLLEQTTVKDDIERCRREGDQRGNGRNEKNGSDQPG